MATKPPKQKATKGMGKLCSFSDHAQNASQNRTPGHFLWAALTRSTGEPSNKDTPLCAYVPACVCVPVCVCACVRFFFKVAVPWAQANPRTGSLFDAQGIRPGQRLAKLLHTAVCPRCAAQISGVQRFSSNSSGFAWTVLVTVGFNHCVVVRLVTETYVAAVLQHLHRLISDETSSPMWFPSTNTRGSDPQTTNPTPPKGQPERETNREL